MKKAAIYTIIKPNKSDSHLSGGFAVITTVEKILNEIGLSTQIISPLDEWVDPSVFDIAVLADIFNDPMGSKWFEPEQYGKFFNCPKFIVLENSYTGCTPEPYGLGGKVDQGGYRTNELSQFMADLMARSSLNIFVSPLHRFEFENFLKTQVPNPYDFYQPIDQNVFYNQRRTRDIPFLYVGALNNFKGLDIAIELFGDRGLHIAGRGDISQYKLPSEAKYLGALAVEDLVSVYNRSQNFVHLPRWQEPFARTVVEAAMCGCNLILNENVGAVSFGYDIRDPNVGTASRLDLKNRISQMWN